MQDFPPTFIVVHPRENRKKCSVDPLRGRAGFNFETYPLKQFPKQAAYVRLAIEGPPLGADDRSKGLIVLDATWRYAERMECDFADYPTRSLPAWKTAYPRVSMWFADPSTGLATIEAIYLAYHILGRDVSGLLESYHWADKFLELNSA